jgi:hypothetical protein
MLQKTEIDEVVSEIDTIVSENSSYDTADVIMKLNNLLTIPYDDDADVIPNIPGINLNESKPNRKGFKDREFKINLSKRKLPNQKLIASRIAKRKLNPSLIIKVVPSEHGQMKRKRSSSLSSERSSSHNNNTTKRTKRLERLMKPNRLLTSSFGGNKTRRRRK